VRRSPLKRKTRLCPSRPWVGNVPQFRIRAKGVPPLMRELVWERGKGRCDICGDDLSRNRWECHHRKLRSQGGADEPLNLLALHPFCHDKAHGNRDWSRRRGYIVHRNDDPATRPVLRHNRRWQLPVAGQWVDCEPPDAEEAA
jgi:hypothetical protein